MKPEAPVVGTNRKRSCRQRRFSSSKAIGLSLILALTISSCRRAGRIIRCPETNILLITIDTTRADRLGCYGYGKARTPNLDRLAAGGIRFERALSPVPLTLPAHASILTGTYPPFHKVRNNGTYFLSPQADTLAEMVKKKGYTTAAFIASFTLDSRFGLDQGFDLFDDRTGAPSQIKGVYSERRAGEVFQSFSSWFGRNKDRKFLAWVHFYDPHMPYEPPEPFRSEPELDPYDGEIANVDVYIGRIITLLRNSNRVFENTLVVVAGDHGEGFGEHGEHGHGVFCYQETLAVPLILYAPGRIPEKLLVTDPVSLVDILPTILDFLETPSPSFIQGISLLAMAENRQKKKRSVYFESQFPLENMGAAPVRGEVRSGWKYIDLPRPEMYDLVRDPEEKENLIKHKPIITREMKASVQRLENKLGSSTVESVRTLTPQERQRLESFGYFSMGSSVKNRKTLPDPKDRIEGWTFFSRGKSLKQLGRSAEAEESLRQAMRLVPDLTGPMIDLGELYFARQDIPALRTLFREGIGSHPLDGELRIRFAYYLVLLGKISEALSQLQEAERIVAFGQREQLYDMLGMAYGTAGDFIRAADSFEKVLQIEPDNADATRKLGYALFRLERMNEALAAYRRAEALIPCDSRLLEEMGRFFAIRKDYLQAETYFQRALRQPDFPPLVLFNYAVLQAERKDYGRASLLMERYLSRTDVDPRSASQARQMLAGWQGR